MLAVHAARTAKTSTAEIALSIVFTSLSDSHLYRRFAAFYSGQDIRDCAHDNRHGEKCRPARCDATAAPRRCPLRERVRGRRGPVLRAGLIVGGLPRERWAG